MKSTLITLIALVALAYAGSFFELWRLPHQKGNPLTYRDVIRKTKKVTGFDEDLILKEREKHRDEQERMFRQAK
jgi:hypothetical protein